MPITYVNIATTTLGSTQSTVVFSSIPQTYTDLVIRCSPRGQFTGTIDLRVWVNNDTSSTLYSTTDLNVFGGTVGSTRYFNRTFWELQNSFQSNSATANTFGNLEVYIPNYTSGANKVASISLASEDNASGFSGSGTGNAMEGVSAHLWRNTSAITSITITGGLAGSSYYLYGIKNS